MTLEEALERIKKLEEIDVAIQEKVIPLLTGQVDGGERTLCVYEVTPAMKKLALENPVIANEFVNVAADAIWRSVLKAEVG
jgi:uncharacterized coiled-coil protein SlyX